MSSLADRLRAAAVPLAQQSAPQRPDPAGPTVELHAPGGPIPELLAHEGAERAVALPVWKPLYEVSEYFTLGGLTGEYRMVAPYDGACEMNILTFAASDQASATLSVGEPLVISNATTYDPAAGGRGLVPFWTAGANSYPIGDSWVPLVNKPTIVFQCTVAASHAAWICIQFRRRINAAGVYTVAER